MRLRALALMCVLPCLVVSKGCTHNARRPVVIRPKHPPDQSTDQIRPPDDSPTQFPTTISDDSQFPRPPRTLHVRLFSTRKNYISPIELDADKFLSTE